MDMEDEWVKAWYGNAYIFFIQDLRFLLWQYDIENKL